LNIWGERTVLIPNIAVKDFAPQDIGWDQVYQAYTIATPTIKPRALQIAVPSDFTSSNSVLVNRSLYDVESAGICSEIVNEAGAADPLAVLDRSSGGEE